MRPRGAHAAILIDLAAEGHRAAISNDDQLEWREFARFRAVQQLSHLGEQVIDDRMVGRRSPRSPNPATYRRSG